nr:hypothetical protein [Microbacterium oxydans]
MPRWCRSAPRPLRSSATTRRRSTWCARPPRLSTSRCGSCLWSKYRKQLDSEIADIANLGGPFAGATTAALFLEHFVGDTPWAHLDIAGTMQTEKDDSWRTAGATGFGARLLLEAARTFPPVS